MLPHQPSRQRPPGRRHALLAGDGIIEYYIPSVTRRTNERITYLPLGRAGGILHRQKCIIFMLVSALALMVAEEQPEQYREYFMERVRNYRERSLTLPNGNVSGLSHNERIRSDRRPPQ